METAAESVPAAYVRTKLWERSTGKGKTKSNDMIVAIETRQMLPWWRRRFIPFSTLPLTPPLILPAAESYT